MTPEQIQLLQTQDLRYLLFNNLISYIEFSLHLLFNILVEGLVICSKFDSNSPPKLTYSGSFLVIGLPMTYGFVLAGTVFTINSYLTPTVL